jgi:hypothetical protein
VALSFVELPRLLAWFARPSAPRPFPPRLQAIDDWTRLFLTYGALPMNNIAHLPVAQALRALETLSEDRIAREEAFEREKALKDHNTMIKLATERGIMLGIEQGIEQGIERGRITGREEGLEQGQREASLALLHDILQMKFGTVPEWAWQRLQAASIATLRQLSVVVLRATTIEEVFSAVSDEAGKVAGPPIIVARSSARPKRKAT